MRRFIHAAALIGVGAAIGFGAVVINAGASPSPETGTNLNVLGDKIGHPLAVRISGSGFAPGSLVYAEQCDGTDPAGVGWSPTSNCDLGSSPSPVIADDSGKAVLLATDANHAFKPFKGESPQSLFNCLSPNQATLTASNGLSDYRNCQVRLSSNNVASTSDQQFFDLTLPDAPWEAFAHPGGGCTGQRILGKWLPVESNVAAAEALSFSLLKSTAVGHPTFAGTCTASGVAGTLTPKSFALKVTGSTSCAATSSDLPLQGKLVITMNETNPATTKPYQIQAYVRRTPGVDASAPDITLYDGVVVKGPGVGSQVSGTLFEDPVTKAVPSTSTPTGYTDTHNQLTQCKAGSATIATVEIGAGTSKFGGSASGLKFGY
ncbi:MAG TPA: hypothetical protein VGP92_17060 [Acidimicrobiia bacterium]|nr:hypothetical protein [Acidimicrobiia bacterium]